MLQGNYDISLNQKMPYDQKMIRIAQEPVAFQLYKCRHFEGLRTEGTRSRESSKEDEIEDEIVIKEYRADILKLINGQMINLNQLKRIK